MFYLPVFLTVTATATTTAATATTTKSTCDTNFTAATITGNPAYPADCDKTAARYNSTASCSKTNHNNPAQLFTCCCKLCDTNLMDLDNVINEHCTCMLCDS